MVLSENALEGGGDELVGDDGGERGGGYTIGGDVSFYEWDFTENMPQKTPPKER